MRSRGIPVVLAGFMLASCAPGPSGPAASPAASAPGPSVATSAAKAPSPSAVACQAKAEALSLPQRVGQLYMVAVSPSGLSSAESEVIKKTGVGSVLLLGESGVSADRVRELTSSLTALGGTSTPILVAVDQEGGQVQRMAGAGFTKIPDAVAQAAMSDAELEQAAATWGSELRKAGIRYNLAPVGDVVPEANAAKNDPVAKLRRGYGSDPAVVSQKATAFIRGMAQAKVATSVKHFPGLGQVQANTDHQAATDEQTGSDSPLWEPFRKAVDAGVPSIMVSSAVYTKLAPGVEAMYSKDVVTGILREKMGYDKVIVSDDVGAAQALAKVPKPERGTRFLLAGGDLVINVDVGALSSGIEHTIAKAEADPAFASQVTRSAARVLELKASVDLIDCG